MRLLFLLLVFFNCQAFSEFRGGLDPRLWYSFAAWKKQQGLKEFTENPRESMGRIISCLGECRLYYGSSFIRGGAHSIVYEGDEIRTQGDSYVWVFLWDGSLLRISPQSSVTFKEFNISPEGFFLFLRLDQGHIYLANRQTDRAKEGVVEKEERRSETDRLFLPLPRSVLEERGRVFGKKPLRPTWNLVTMANGSFYGRGLQVNIFFRQGGDGFIQQVREREKHFFLQFWPRGYDEGVTKELVDKKVYRVHPLGERIQESFPFFFAKSNLVIKRIPSILAVREQWLRRYVRFLHDPKNLNEEGLSRRGFRLWQGWGKGEEMARRIKFLYTYNRKVETAYNYRVHRVKRAEGWNLPVLVSLPPFYYEKPYRHYIRRLDQRDPLD